MKKITIISLLIGCMAMGTMTTSCEDMLSPDSERHSYVVAQDTLYSYWGIIKSLQNVAERYVVLGECRGDLVSGTSYVSDTIDNILKFKMNEATDGSCRFLKASDYYHIINSCNVYLAKCDTLRRTGTLQPYILKEAAQVEAIRAWTYLQLVQVYGRVPFYTEPLITTDDISAFMANHPTVDMNNIASLLAPGLEKARNIEGEYGLPQYENYQNVCHSTKVMIPINVILGDLYLTSGNYEDAARCYFAYLSNFGDMGNTTPGGSLPIAYCYGDKSEGEERPTYRFTGTAPWVQTGAVSATQEAVTAIPSSTNKLWGSVLRGVNALFGYDSEISVRTENTNDTTTNTSASIILTPKYDVKQLAASQAYFDLCKAQNFELYIAATASAAASKDTVTIDPEIGDARQYWVRDVSQTYSNGLRNTEKFITKQNPNGSFSTVAHMIYRKSMIWLRFAEALNRAGYPSYAFAILKNGLCNNENWYPEAEPRINAKNEFIVDYTVKDSAWVFFSVKKDETVTPARLDSILYPGNVVVQGKPKEVVLRKFIYDMAQDGLLDSAKDSLADLNRYLEQQVADGLMTQEEVDAGIKLYVPKTFMNYPDSGCSQALYYLNRREVEKKPSFLNFKYTSLNGNASSETFFYRTSLTDRAGIVRYSQSLTSDDRITYGIHSHGCGMLRYNDRSSSYNYVDKVKEFADSLYNTTLTIDDIYNGAYDDIVQKCVEDLIIDEAALELAFEGTRFFDLLRVANRRGDIKYITDKIKKRDPSINLTSWDDLFFPLPQK